MKHVVCYPIVVEMALVKVVQDKLYSNAVGVSLAGYTTVSSLSARKYWTIGL